MRIRTGCRLHFGLIDLNGEIGRIDGGVGLAIDKPGMDIEFNPSDTLTVEGPDSDAIRNAARLFLDHFETARPGTFTVHQTIPRHIGLGSGTQLALATAKLLAEHNDISISTRELSHVVQRGGTSGIGTATFDEGGFILDGGHSTEEKNEFLPSSAAGVRPPPVISQVNFPDWHTSIFVPPGNRIHGKKEYQLFKSETPIQRADVMELSHIVVMKLLPSVIDANYQEFRESVESVQTIGWKRLELENQPKSSHLISELSKRNIAAGLSSWGPVVFAISPDPIEYESTEYSRLQVNPDNSGAKLIS